MNRLEYELFYCDELHPRFIVTRPSMKPNPILMYYPESDTVWVHDYRDTSLIDFAEETFTFNKPIRWLFNERNINTSKYD